VITSIINDAFAVKAAETNTVIPNNNGKYGQTECCHIISRTINSGQSCLCLNSKY
jgi:hypothetical protein